MISEDSVMLFGHYRDLLQEAERERLAQQALRPSRQVRRPQLALAWLGSLLVVWGRYLQRRYAFTTLDSKVMDA